jgi:hypothetical protein
MRTLTLASALSLLLAAAASAQSAKLDPCVLVTQAEVKAALGMEVGALKINTMMGASAGTLCDFQVGEIGAGGILLRALSTVETPQKIRAESDKAGIKTSDAQGFGTGAFYAIGSYGVTQLNAFKGSTQVMVQLMLTTSPPDKVREALARLMTAVLPKVK